MTPTTIQVGDTGKLKNMDYTWRVVAVLPGLLLVEYKHDGAGVTYHCAPADFIPDPKPAPKAVPGQLYRHVDWGTTAVGLLTGRLWPGGGRADFDPAKWTPIEEPQP